MPAIRQGDVLVITCDKIPPTAKPVPAKNGRLILARGEATGHHHSVALSERVAMFRDDGAGGGAYLSVSDGVTLLRHQEHTALPLPPGSNEVHIQRTFRAGVVRHMED